VFERAHPPSPPVPKPRADGLPGPGRGLHPLPAFLSPPIAVHPPAPPPVISSTRFSSPAHPQPPISISPSSEAGRSASPEHLGVPKPALPPPSSRPVSVPAKPGSRPLWRSKPPEPPPLRRFHVWPPPLPPLTAGAALPRGTSGPAPSGPRCPIAFHSAAKNCWRKFRQAEIPVPSGARILAGWELLDRPPHEPASGVPDAPSPHESGPGSPSRFIPAVTASFGPGRAGSPRSNPHQPIVSVVPSLNGRPLGMPPETRPFRPLVADLRTSLLPMQNQRGARPRTTRRPEGSWP